MSLYSCARGPQVHALDGFGGGLPTFLKTSVGSHVGYTRWRQNTPLYQNVGPIKYIVVMKQLYTICQLNKKDCYLLNSKILKTEKLFINPLHSRFIY